MRALLPPGVCPPLPGALTPALSALRVSEGRDPVSPRQRCPRQKGRAVRAAGERCLQAAGGSCRLPAAELGVTAERRPPDKAEPAPRGLAERPHSALAPRCVAPVGKSETTSSDGPDGGSSALSEAATPAGGGGGPSHRAEEGLRGKGGPLKPATRGSCARVFTAEETADANPRGSVNAESRRGGRKEAQEREWARAALLAAPQAVSGPGCSGRTSDTHTADRRGRHLSSISRGL